MRSVRSYRREVNRCYVTLVSRSIYRSQGFSNDRVPKDQILKVPLYFQILVMFPPEKYNDDLRTLLDTF